MTRKEHFGGRAAPQAEKIHASCELSSPHAVAACETQSTRTALMVQREESAAERSAQLRERMRVRSLPAGKHVLLTEKQVREKTSLAHTTIHKLRRQGMFCEPIPIGTGGVRYIESEIDAWIEAGMAQRKLGGATE